MEEGVHRAYHLHDDIPCDDDGDEEGGNDDSIEVQWLVRMDGHSEVEEDVHTHEIRTFLDCDK